MDILGMVAFAMLMAAQLCAVIAIGSLETKDDADDDKSTGAVDNMVTSRFLFRPLLRRREASVRPLRLVLDSDGDGH